VPQGFASLIGLSTSRKCVRKQDNKRDEKRSVNKKGNDDKKRINDRKPGDDKDMEALQGKVGLCNCTQLNRTLEKLFWKGRIREKRTVIGHRVDEVLKNHTTIRGFCFLMLRVRVGVSLQAHEI
jgi:hypothetical protein